MLMCNLVCCFLGRQLLADLALFGTSHEQTAAFRGNIDTQGRKFAGTGSFLASFLPDAALKSAILN